MGKTLQLLKVNIWDGSSNCQWMWCSEKAKHKRFAIKFKQPYDPTPLASERRSSDRRGSRYNADMELATSRSVVSAVRSSVQA
jgi:hypothetical protein